MLGCLEFNTLLLPNWICILLQNTTAFLKNFTTGSLNEQLITILHINDPEKGKVLQEPLLH